MNMVNQDCYKKRDSLTMNKLIFKFDSPNPIRAIKSDALFKAFCASRTLQPSPFIVQNWTIAYDNPFIWNSDCYDDHVAKHL